AVREAGVRRPPPPGVHRRGPVHRGQLGHRAPGHAPGATIWPTARDHGHELGVRLPPAAPSARSPPAPYGLPGGPVLPCPPERLPVANGRNTGPADFVTVR